MAAVVHSMNRLFLARLAGFLLLLVPAASTLAQVPGELVSKIDAIFAKWTAPDAPGVVIAVSQNGQVVLTRAYGQAEIEHDLPNTEHTRFESGSVSKQFTAAAIILLAQQGKLALTDDVRKHIPEIPDYGTPITLRHLLNHTSGLRDWGSLAAIAGWPRERRSHTQDHVIDILRRQRGLNYTPGDRYAYTNSGYNLLAIIVARVSGLPFAAFCRAQLFEPLGLEHTEWRDDHTRIVKDRATAYSPRSDGSYAIDQPIEDVHGNGGLITTVRDLITWNEALATQRIGAPGFTEEMQRNGILNDGSRIDYASGLMVSTHRHVPEIAHTGSTSGYRAFLGRYPVQGLGIALLANAGNVNPGALGRQVADVFLGDAVGPVPVPAAPEPPPPAPTPTAEELAPLAGEYFSPDVELVLRITIEEGRLIALRRPATRIVLTPVAADTFTAPGLGRVRFIRDTPGFATQLSVQQERVYDLRFERRVR
jgi:CubicO group peptidase (beta-lactamase class C family)